MDIISGIIAALGTAAAAIIGAVALLKRASAPTSRAMIALQQLWDWLDHAGLTADVPERLKRSVQKLLDEGSADDSDKGAK